MGQGHYHRGPSSGAPGLPVSTTPPPPTPCCAVSTRCAFNAPHVLLPLQADAGIARPSGPASQNVVRVRSREAHGSLSGGRDQDGECWAALGSRPRLCRCFSPRCLSPPSFVFLLPRLSLSLALSPFSAPSMSTLYFEGRGESAHFYFFPVSRHQSLLPLPPSLCLFLHLCLCVSASESLSGSLSTSLSLRLCLWACLHLCLWVSVLGPCSGSLSLGLHVSLPLSPLAWLSSPMSPPPPAPAPLAPAPAHAAAGLAAVSWRSDNLAAPVRAAAPPPVRSGSGGGDLREGERSHLMLGQPRG